MKHESKPELLVSTQSPAGLTAQTPMEARLSTPTLQPSPLTGNWGEYAWPSREASEILMKAESAILLASELGEDDPLEDTTSNTHSDDMAHSEEQKSAHDEVEEKVAAPFSVDAHYDENMMTSATYPHSYTTQYELEYPSAYSGIGSYPTTGSEEYYNTYSGAPSSSYSTDYTSYQPCTYSTGYCYCANCTGHYPVQATIPPPVAAPPLPQAPYCSTKQQYVSAYPKVDSYSAYAYPSTEYDQSMYYAPAPESVASEYSADAGTPSFVHQYRGTDSNSSRRRKSTRFPVPPPPTKCRNILSDEKYYHTMMRWYSHIHDWDISKTPCPAPLTPENDSFIEYSYEDWLTMVEEWYKTHFSNTRRPVRARQ